MFAPWKKSCNQLRQHIKMQRHYFANKGPSSQSYGFSRSRVWVWEFNSKDSWGPKTCCFWTMVLKKTLESPLDCKEIQPVHPEGCQSWTFIGRTDADAETSNFWPPMQSTDSLEKHTDPGVDWRPKGKGMTEDEMVRWHHQINRHEFA